MSYIKMNVEILNVINAVVNYGRYLYSHYAVTNTHGLNFDYFAEMEKYYYSLPLPDGMSPTHEDFKKILQIGWYTSHTLERLNNTSYNDLSSHFWK